MTMTKFAAVTALASSFALTACGGGTVDADSDGDGTVTAEEADVMVSDIRPEPGNYSVTMNIVKADIPGASKEMMDAMGAMMNRSFEMCLTQEEAEKGFEGALMDGQGENCTIDKFQLTGNDLDMAMSCARGPQGDMKTTMTGTVEPNRADLNVSMKGTLPQVGEAEMQMSMLRERIGDCDS